MTLTAYEIEEVGGGFVVGQSVMAKVVVGAPLLERQYCAEMEDCLAAIDKHHRKLSDWRERNGG